MPSFVDAHCHVRTPIDDTEDSKFEIGNDGEIIRCVMSTNNLDWEKVKRLKGCGDQIIRCFGIHPWYSHLFSNGDVRKVEHYADVLDYKDESEFVKLLNHLPDPIPIELYIRKEFDTNSVMVIGEIGLDKLFRLPESGFYTDGEHPLSRVKVKMSHQIFVFTRMCQLASKYDKPVSIHNVKSHGQMYDICKQELFNNVSIKICLHSYSGSLDSLKSFWLKEYGADRIYLSLSKWINFKSLEDAKNLVSILPVGSILTETDYPIDTFSSKELKEKLQFICIHLQEFLKLDSVDEVKSLVLQNFQNYIGQE
ncbi:hypothetical protein Kpol_361p1 [Vanderwaltozyma polyspora DSM 70294]|uniref:Uncharacterized protein n=1 Tax=Vanderwaltozyma polyspora (strain ATCC 22028 / DSM 70294 / BCRC 21397 / CBS 2163 / NBRC 10782 / NRRL Y-8283 / UCD 57-17) TaxID=436907 RepID=A7TT40_VANPO|nr:uncharacterized protein Kpol_361p1 [Vanderwaltozyma polyspora DSM 70294]EDO14564.1 hypothetical protein Kpol_361p1 [Vanderwaltozyma polyspora DSM 70294]